MKTTYKVMAATGFRGFKQGEKFEAELDPDQERRALKRGSIKKMPTRKKEEEEKADG